MLKFLLVGDLHYQPSNVMQSIPLETQLMEYVGYMIVFMGDLLHCHERLDMGSLNRVVSLVTRLSRRNNVYVLVGNHDMVNNNQFCNQNHWMNVLKEVTNVTVVDTPIWDEATQVAMFPYIPSGRFAEAVEMLAKPIDQAKFVLAHQEFRGCHMGAITSKSSDEYIWAPKCFTGHIHDKHQVGKVTYVGACMQHTYGNAKAWLHVIEPSGEPGGVKVTAIPSAAREKQIRHVETVEELNKLVLADTIDYKLITNDYYVFEYMEKNRTHGSIPPNTKLCCKPREDEPEPRETEDAHESVPRSIIDMFKNVLDASLYIKYLDSK